MNMNDDDIEPLQQVHLSEDSALRVALVNTITGCITGCAFMICVTAITVAFLLR